MTRAAEEIPERHVPVLLQPALDVFALYTLEHHTRALEHKNAKVQSESDNETIGQINAQWCMLTRPQRLERLARHHLDIEPPMPDQMITDKQVISSLPPGPAVARDKTLASEDPLADLLRMIQ